MRLVYLSVLLFVSFCALAQNFTKSDTLRGSLLPERVWYDVNYYHLNIDVNPTTKSINGYNDIGFSVLEPNKQMQLDLFENMHIDSVVYQGRQVSYNRLYNTFYVTFDEVLELGLKATLRVYYHGQPIQAKNAPWDGGFVWKKDPQGLPWIGVACQGVGASSWWPCKDHLSDEPDSMRISCTVPEQVQFVGNGNLESTIIVDDKRKSTWKVTYPINTYNVTLNIADYSHLSDVYENGIDALLLDYYVLRGNEQKAIEHFEQVKPMLRAYEELFGPYSFWNDGFALVETPYLGMEHQSAIAYGNKYMPGYLGRYPEHMDFDFIIIHETGHEYWGNSVSMNDLADMWIHESFCTYTEALYVEKRYGYASMLNYLAYQKNFINNKSPIQGHRHVNHQGNHTDMYYKGSWMLHSIRNSINDDVLWFEIVKEVYSKFAISNCDGDEIKEYMSKLAGQNLTPIFNQYLNYADLPLLRYSFVEKANKLFMEYYWDVEETSFNMPVVVRGCEGQEIRLIPTDLTQQTEIGSCVKADVEFVENLFLFEKIKE